MKKADKFRRLGWLLLSVLLLFSILPPGQRFWRAMFRLSEFDTGTDAPLSIHVLDVGKADAILIQCEGHAALVDAGTSLSGRVVLDYMARNHIGPLDYAIASHPDQDHLGGMAQVLSEAGAGAFVRAPYFAEQYRKVQNVLAENFIPLQVVSPGDVLALGGAELLFLGPVKEYADTNNSSLVFRLDYAGFSALFCGDVEEEAEKDLVKSGENLAVDLLKVPHHGRKTSSTKRFLAAVNPRYAVIPSGNGSDSDLPQEEALVRLEEAHAVIRRTDTDGTIVFSYDGKDISIKTEQDRKGLFA